MGQGEEHATYSILFESSMLNTGDFVRDVKGSGEVGQGRPQRNAKALRRVGWGIVVCARESRAHQDED